MITGIPQHNQKMNFGAIKVKYDDIDRVCDSLEYGFEKQGIYVIKGDVLNHQAMAKSQVDVARREQHVKTFSMVFFEKTKDVYIVAQQKYEEMIAGVLGGMKNYRKGPVEFEYKPNL